MSSKSGAPIIIIRKRVAHHDDEHGRQRQRLAASQVTEFGQAVFLGGRHQASVIG